MHVSIFYCCGQPSSLLMKNLPVLKNWKHYKGQVNRFINWLQEAWFLWFIVGLFCGWMVSQKLFGAVEYSITNARDLQFLSILEVVLSLPQGLELCQPILLLCLNCVYGHLALGTDTLVVPLFILFFSFYFLELYKLFLLQNRKKDD